MFYTRRRWNVQCVIFPVGLPIISWDKIKDTVTPPWCIGPILVIVNQLRQCTGSLLIDKRNLGLLKFCVSLTPNGCQTMMCCYKAYRAHCAGTWPKWWVWKSFKIAWHRLTCFGDEQASYSYKTHLAVVISQKGKDNTIIMILSRDPL